MFSCSLILIKLEVAIPYLLTINSLFAGDDFVLYRPHFERGRSGASGGSYATGRKIEFDQKYQIRKDR